MWSGNIWAYDADEVAQLLSKKGARIKIINNCGEESNPYIFRSGIIFQTKAGYIWEPI